MPQRSLTAPDQRFAPSYLEALREGYRLGDDPPLGAEAIGAIAEDVPAHIAGITRQGTLHRFPDGTWIPLSPFTLLWFVDDSREFLGALHIRHTLAHEYARTIAGHVRYGIRPSRRGQGLGTEMLELAKDHARGLGHQRLLVVCREANTASRRLIERCGGVFETTVLDPHGAGVKRRYWIEL